MAAGPTPDLPKYTLDVQALDLGQGTKAVGLELIETESREPLTGEVAGQIWSVALPALSKDEPFVVDFFSHLDRIREFCTAHLIPFREAAQRCIVVQQPSAEQFHDLLARFEKETFGFRSGPAATQEDVALEGELSQRGLDAYQAAYTRYTFCAVCEPSDGWVTLLSETLWATEIIRRVRPALQSFDVYMVRPQ